MEIIFAAVASLVVQGIKKWSGSSEYMTLFYVVVVSLAAAAVFAAMQGADIWDSFVGILVKAGAIYTFLIARFESGSTISKMLK